MKIYTKTGDKGETSLHGGKRVRKDALRIVAYGTVDELSSVLGVCRSFNTVRNIDVLLEEIQLDLFTLGADLAAPEKAPISRITTDEITRLEKHIDDLEPQLPPLVHFILPGGNRTAAMLHVARTVCRRAERIIVRLGQKEALSSDPQVFLNRLSDLLFILARYSNMLGDTPEKEWVPK
ncbi:MAG TPA: cob(I)yrinic acid a,c-diamide adenosyltransferase [Bacteroidota bacterium]|nr:cob(I)yrinic acid a,c-diamide adenosyltransferase [Bacteroidota bacterium]